MRFKVGIVKDNLSFSLCNSHLETLLHIFLKCSHTVHFIARLRTFIKMKLDPQYRDQNNIYLSPVINYVNITAKRYIS